MCVSRMSKVLTVSTALNDDGSLDVECASMAGRRLRVITLPQESTIEDVVDALKNRLGLPKAYFDVYAAGEIIVDRRQLASDRQYIMSEDAYGPARKFLAALSKKAFHPKCRHFDVNWTERTAPDVDQADVARFLEGLGVSSRAETERLMRVFGRLTSVAENWNMFDLALLQNFDPGMNTFKHALCDSWLQVARSAAKQKVSRDASPLFLPCVNEHGRMIRVSLFGADGTFPESVDRGLQDSLSLSDVRPCHSLHELMFAAASLQWDANHAQVSREVVEEAFHLFEQHRQCDIVLEPRPTPEDVVRMAHVQLLLSCNVGPVRVEGSLPPNLVQSVATLLRWHMRVLRFGVDQLTGKALEQYLDQEMQVAFESQGRFRGVPRL